MTLSANVKSTLKNLVYGSLLLRRFFVWIYKARGRKPWSAGYAVYKFGFIRDAVEHRLDDFRKSTLPPEYGTRLDERVVEYPWVFSRLKESERTILDAGSSLNHTDILSFPFWQGRSLTISTLAYEGIPRSDFRPTYVYEDMRHMSFSDATFDAVICISSLEHVGMDNTFLYTPDSGRNEHDPGAFITAVKELRRVLKNGGTLYLTMPYGRHEDHHWFQVFDAGMVSRIKETFAASSAQESYFKYENGQWNYSDAGKCKDGTYFDIHKETTFRDDHLAASESVVCLELRK